MDALQALQVSFVVVGQMIEKGEHHHLTIADACADAVAQRYNTTSAQKEQVRDVALSLVFLLSKAKVIP